MFLLLRWSIEVSGQQVYWKYKKNGAPSWKELLFYERYFNIHVGQGAIWKSGIQQDDSV